MPVLKIVRGVVIKIYTDHGPPHVHLVPQHGKYLRYFFREKDLWKNERIPRECVPAVDWILDNLPEVEREWSRLNAPIEYRTRRRGPRKGI